MLCNRCVIKKLLFFYVFIPINVSAQLGIGRYDFNKEVWISEYKLSELVISPDDGLYYTKHDMTKVSGDIIGDCGILIRGMSNGQFVSGNELNFYDNCKLKKINRIYKSQLHGEQLEYYSTGFLKQIIHFKNGVLEGDFVAWYKGSKIWESKLSEFEELNFYKFIKEDSVTNQLVYIQDPDTGQSIHGWQGRNSGQIKESGSYKEGEKHGVFKHWRYDEFWETKMEHGDYLLTHFNARLEKEENYFFGQKNGLCRAWYKNGQLNYTKKYSYGNLIEDKCWDEDGSTLDCN